MDSSQIVTMHIQSVDHNRAIKTVKRTITELDRSKIEEQKKAIRAGYDIDIIPSDLATYGRDAKALLKELQSQNERMFLVTFLVLNTGRTEQELENNVFQASSIAQKHNCNLCRLDFQQEQGLMSSLPLADCQIEIQRGLTTSSTAIFIPFTTQELYQSGKESLYYGLNALSNNLIMVDRKKLKSPNGLILGTPGSGKSFSAKREIANAFLVTDDDIIVNDSEGEYSPLVNRLKGQVIKISPNSTQFINPMDINANYSEEDNPLSLKADFILSLCELVVGGKEGLLPVEKTVIDRCVHLIYRKYFADPCPENMPILEDLYLINEQTYLHLRENLAGVGYEVFDKNSPLPVEEGQIPREALGNSQRRIETARAYYLAEHQDEPVGRIQNVAVTTLEKFRSGVRRRRNLAPRSLPDNDVRFIDPMYNELCRVPDGGVVQMTFPDGHQRSEKVEYLDDYHMKIGSSVQHICEFAERMARSHAIVEPEPLTQQEQRAWNLEYDFYLTVQADNGSWDYALYQGDCCLLERGKIDAPELMIEEVRDEILYSHNLRNKDCIPLTQEEFAQKLADRNEIQSYRMKQFQQSGHDCYLVMQLHQDADPALRFSAMRYLNKQNIAPSVENYEILYRGNLPEGKRSVPQAELLEQLYQKFNFARPTDYHGHSLSVSDVIMLNQDGKISAHYVDSIGFKELPGFLDKKQERTSVLMNLREKCDAPECNPTGCRKARNAHEL